ncbi:MAG: hypothetical protein P8Z81_04885 [Deinococcales bacterium]
MRRLLTLGARGRVGVRGADDTPDTLRERLLAAMDEPGCPLCRLVREQERRYFFWFFAENYHAPETLGRLVASHGFCRQHATGLAARHADRASAIAVVYELVSRKVGVELAAEARRKRPAWPPRTLSRCPACADRERTERRFLEALAELIRDGGGRARYRPPHLLCLTHLQGLEPLLGGADLRRVVEVHLAWLDQAARADPDGARRTPDAGSGADGDEGASDERAALASLVKDVGVVEVAAAHRGLGGDPLDVERAVSRVLDDDERCPVCAARTNALLAWERYCEAHVGDREPIDELLPTCDVHVSSLLAHGGQELRAATLRHLAGRVRDTLSRTLAALPGERAGSWPGMLRRLLSGGGEPGDQRARRTLRRGVSCPVCSELATTEDRALSLVGTLVRSGPGAERYGRGHGVCLRHLSAAVSERTDPSDARRLLEHARSDVELLTWRLREAGRLDGWNVRPLPGVPDEAVWRRALYRYVGEPT